MKNTPLLFCLSILLLSCQPNTEQNKIPNTPISKISFVVDERTEFLRTAFNLAVLEDFDENILPCETAYYQAVKKHFLPFKNHPLIQYIYDKDEFAVDFSSAGLLIEDLPTMKFGEVYEEEMLRRGFDSLTLVEFRPLAIDFYQKTNFHQFYLDHNSDYQEATAQIARQVKEEQILPKIQSYYKDERKGLEFIVFVELTNNINNQAIDFLDNYNPMKRAFVMGNFCDLNTQISPNNTILQLDNDYRGIICHEVSHLYTTSKYLDKYLGKLDDFRPLFEDDLSDIRLKDRVDHMIVNPLQSILIKRFYQLSERDSLYRNLPDGIEQKVYLKLAAYQPEQDNFEKTYAETIEMIRSYTLSLQ